jgi:hypothetical protein
LRLLRPVGCWAVHPCSSIVMASSTALAKTSSTQQGWTAQQPTGRNNRNNRASAMPSGGGGARPGKNCPSLFFDCDGLVNGLGEDFVHTAHLLAAAFGVCCSHVGLKSDLRNKRTCIELLKTQGLTPITPEQGENVAQRCGGTEVQNLGIPLDREMLEDVE